MSKINTYSFRTNDNFRVDVKASNPNAAYKKLLSIPYFSNKITKNYFKYDKDGLYNNNLGWRTINYD